MTVPASSTTTPRGVCTVAYLAADHEGAKKWYAEVIGVAPYMDKPGYAEFRFGDYQHELGIIDAKFIGVLGGGEAAPAPTPGGAIAYWHVDDVEATLDRLVAMGARLFHPPRDFGEGFVGATVIDPFGNVFGIMRNPHYLAVLAGRTMTGERKSEVAMNAVRPTVARIWRGSTRPERADDYEAYLYAHGLGDLQEHSLGVQMLRRDGPDATEFLVMSFWESVAAMSRFAGSDPARIRHLARDADYLIALPEAVEVFDIKASNLPAPFAKA